MSRGEKIEHARHTPPPLRTVVPHENTARGQGGLSDTKDAVAARSGKDASPHGHPRPRGNRPPAVRRAEKKGSARVAVPALSASYVQCVFPRQRDLPRGP